MVVKIISIKSPNWENIILKDNKNKTTVPKQQKLGGIIFPLPKEVLLENKGH